jgi:uncharacterized protein (TIGR00369 family)
MATHEPRDSDFKERVQLSFGQQRFMRTLGARLTAVAAGVVEIDLPHREELTQQHGYLHAGAVAAVLDSACGYAAYSLADATSAVLTVEYKINLIAPAITTVKARGYVLKRGNTLTVCRAEAVSTGEERERLFAAMTATIMEIRNSDVTA